MMRRPARTTLIPGRGKRPVQVERTPLQGFLARKAVQDGKVGVERGKGSQNTEAAVSGAPTRSDAVPAPPATKPKIPAVLSTAPLADDVARLVRGKNRFPREMIATEAGAC